PCQGEGRGFESRRPLERPSLLGRLLGHAGGVAERRGNGLQSRLHGFESRLHLDIRFTRAIGAVVARFLDTDEVPGSIPVSPTIPYHRHSILCSESKRLTVDTWPVNPPQLSVNAIHATFCCHTLAQQGKNDSLTLACSLWVLAGWVHPF